MTPETGCPNVIEREAELGTLPILPVGIVVELARPDGSVWRYYGLGTTTPAIAARLGWTHVNVWLREIERNRMLRVRGRLLFPQLEEAIAQVLRDPISVHEARGDPLSLYFIASGESLRVRGLMMSQSVSFVDAIIEARTTDGGEYLRLYHFSPRNRGRGGRRLWP